MKPFLMVRKGAVATIGELSLWDMILLMLGREIEVIDDPIDAIVIRARLPYELFNLSAPAQKIIDGDQDNLRQEK